VAGCPVCGYSLPPGGASPGDFFDSSDLPVRTDVPAAPLPVWIWLIALAALAAAVFGMWSVL